MIRAVDVAWAAGFLEGEGTFCNAGSPRVDCGQAQREPLERLVALFGGSLTLRKKTNGFGSKPIWIWRLYANEAVQVMMTLYVLMSPKRKAEIEAALTRWRDGRMMKVKGTGRCGYGHPLEGDNVFTVNGYVKCRTCHNDRKRERRARLKASA